MAQGAIDFFLKSKSPVQSIEGSDRVVMESDASVILSDNSKVDDSDIVTDLRFDSNDVLIEDETPKPIKVMDIFKSFGKRKKEKEVEKIEIVEDPVIILDSSPAAPRVSAFDILNGNKKKEGPILLPDDDIVIINDKRKVNARDLLTGAKKSDLIEIISDDESTSKKKKKNKKMNGSLIVKFKYKSHKQKISELEEKMKNSSAKSMKSKDLLTSFTSKTPDKPSALSTLLQHRNINRMNPISKLKEIELPEIRKDQFHVKEEIEFSYRSISLTKKHELIKDEINYKEFPFKSLNSFEKSFFEVKNIEIDLSLYELAEAKIPKLRQYPYFNRFIKLLENETKLSNESWNILFKPLKSQDLLINQKIILEMKNWLANSFKILKKPTKRPDFKKYKKKELDDMDGFIDDDYGSDETEYQEYIPLMIIHGPYGVGKTSAIYSLVEESKGYIHEINASQNRSRKDIFSDLKELSTTQLVHKNQELVDSNEFQEGVILFEDVDILFEQDKGFWSVVQNLVTISRRPIIITCSKIDSVPNEILDLTIKENSIFEIEKQNLKLLKKYLFLIGLVNKFIIDENALNEILIENNFDLRKSINRLEFLCKLHQDSNLKRIKFNSKNKKIKLFDDIEDLNEYSQKIDIESISNVIDKHEYSLLNNFTEIEFDATDLKIIDEIEEKPLYFEFNFTKEINQMLPKYPDLYNQLNEKKLIELDREFFKTKLKFSKRLTRRTTTSTIFENFDDSYDNEVFDILPSSTYFTEISPIIREFARNEIEVDEFNESLLKEETEKRTSGQLIHNGLARKTKFNGDPAQLLTGSLAYWNSIPYK